MAENREVFISGHEHQRRVHGSQVVCASLAGMAIGGPLLGTMGLSFMASVAILLVSTPLLLLFSPIIFFAGPVLGGAVAALMVMSGLSTLEWGFHQVKGRRDVGFGEGSTVRERGKDWAGYLQENFPNNNRNRGWKEQGGGI